MDEDSLFHSDFDGKLKADSWEVMHLSMVRPRIGGEGDQRECDIFRFLNVNFPILGSPLRVKSTTSGTHNTSTQVELHEVKFQWDDPPPPPTPFSSWDKPLIGA